MCPFADTDVTWRSALLSYPLGRLTEGSQSAHDSPFPIVQEARRDARNRTAGGYYPGSTMTSVAVKKLSVALDADVAERAAREAEEEGLSLSAWLTRAAREALAIEAGRRAVREYEAEYGAFTEEERAIARAELDELLGPRPEEP